MTVYEQFIADADRTRKAFASVAPEPEEPLKPPRKIRLRRKRSGGFYDELEDLEVGAKPLRRGYLQRSATWAYAERHGGEFKVDTDPDDKRVVFIRRVA